MTEVQEKDIGKICVELLSDCNLTIEFDSVPFVVTLIFISNMDRKKIVLKCNKISKFSIEKNPVEYPFYTILETKIVKINSDWMINVVPNIDATIICEDIYMTVEDLSDQQLVEYGLIEPP
jgi:hypothetical protein